MKQNQNVLLVAIAHQSPASPTFAQVREIQSTELYMPGKQHQKKMCQKFQGKMLTYLRLLSHFLGKSHNSSSQIQALILLKSQF